VHTGAVSEVMRQPLIIYGRCDLGVRLSVKGDDP
jgi:hypothetical protein